MGESARKPGCPELPKTPLELLTPRPGEGFTLFQNYIWPATGIALGLGTAITYNVLSRRPKWAGLPIHLMCMASGYFLMVYIRDMRYAGKSDDDAVLRHYITLHPEDFPPYERKRWRDVYQPFEPYR